MKKPSNIILIGMMGAGKTTIGKALAKQMKRQFFDLDYEIIKRCGVSIPTIFDIEGEEGFRKREHLTLEEVMKSSNIVLATGGGAILREENQQILRNGCIIYLHASAEALYSRIAFDKNRPLMATEDPMKKIQDLIRDRHHIYEHLAHLKIDTSSGTIAAIVREIQKELTTKHLL